MKKAWITLVKRQIITSNTDNKIFKDIFDDSFLQSQHVGSNWQRGRYSLHLHGGNLQLKDALDSAATTGSMNAIFKLNRFIPDFWDCSHRINLKMRMESGKLPSVKVEVIEFNSEAKEELQLGVYFETDFLILLDSIEGKALLSFPNSSGEDDLSQSNYRETFFLRLTDDIYFNEYKLL